MLEEIGQFVQALEKLLPSYFKNAYKVFSASSEYSCLSNQFEFKFLWVSKIYLFVLNRAGRKNVTKGKRPLNQTTIDILKAKLTEEYEFYYFVKQHFHNSLVSLGIKAKSSSHKG